MSDVHNVLECYQTLSCLVTKEFIKAGENTPHSSQLKNVSFLKIQNWCLQRNDVLKQHPSGFFVYLG